MSLYIMFLCMSLFQECLMFSMFMWRWEPVPHKPGGSVMVTPNVSPLWWGNQPWGNTIGWQICPTTGWGKV